MSSTSCHGRQLFHVFPISVLWYRDCFNQVLVTMADSLFINTPTPANDGLPNQVRDVRPRQRASGAAVVARAQNIRCQCESRYLGSRGTPCVSNTPQTPLTNTHPSRLQGAAVFLSNPRLCPELITRLAAANKLRQLRLPPSLVATLNGDAVACE